LRILKGKQINQTTAWKSEKTSKRWAPLLTNSETQTVDVHYCLAIPKAKQLLLITGYDLPNPSSNRQPLLENLESEAVIHCHSLLL
jgi:hypothetical protein